MSESTTHSDSSIPYNAFAVRINHAFGLRNPLQYFCCPNQLPIRTPYSLSMLLLSESTTYSDSVTPCNAFAVRINHVFGLRHSLQGLNCPNYPLIRTPQSLAMLLLSESTTHSDSVTPCNTFTVQINHPFGHCHSLQCFCCPNQPRIRTPPFLTMLLLSELPSHSDSAISCNAFAVRINHPFGLLHSLQGFCCPNQPPIRTPPFLTRLLLSESAPHSDSVTPCNAFTVRISPSLALL